MQVAPDSRSKTPSTAFRSLLAISLLILPCGAICAQSQSVAGYWARVGGPSTAPACSGDISCPQAAGVVGSEFQFSSENSPGGRLDAATWTGSDGKLWLFGGYGYDATGTWGYLSDLWAFDPTLGANGEWAWMGGNTGVSTNCPSAAGFCGAPGVYGTEFQFGAGTPGARSNAAVWTDKSGRFWLFGGQGMDSNGTFSQLNDLWVFDPSQGSDGEWAWMGGSKINTVCITNSVCGAPGAYGAEYQFAGADAPGGRTSPLAWTDSNGRFWMYGGSGFDSAGSQGPLNDLWVFDPAQGTHGQWAWMGGGQAAQPNGWAGNYGTEYQFADSNVPGQRSRSLSWIDADNRLWLFGGFGQGAAGGFGDLNDLWAFDPAQGAHGQWAWMGGSETMTHCVADFGCGQPDVYGPLYQFNTTDTPGGRWLAAGWTDKNGRPWMLGGEGVFQYGSFGYLDDLWVFDETKGSHGEWAWAGGQTGQACQPGGNNCITNPSVDGSLNQFASAYHPGGITNPMTWTGLDGNFWFFGGQLADSASNSVFNDMWEFRLLPIGYLDQAVDAQTHSTTVAQSDNLAVSGWAINPNGIAVNQVQILIDGKAAGSATLGIARTDVETAYNDPAYLDSGWSFTYAAAGLSIGSHSVSAVASDAANGLSVTLGTATINVSASSTAPPFGYLDQAIDSSTKSTTVGQSGSLLVTGWAADQKQGAPVSQVQILIDGKAVGTATLGLPRPDVEKALNNPSYLDSGWTFTYSASSLTLGNHTVTAKATDSSNLSTTLGPVTINVTTGQ